MKKMINGILTVLICVLLLTGCAKKQENYDTFNFRDLTISVPAELKFEEVDLDEYDFAIGSDQLMLFSDYITLEQIEANGWTVKGLEAEIFKGRDVQEINGYPTFFYNNSVDGDDYYYSYTEVLTDEGIYDVHMTGYADDEETIHPYMEDIISRLKH